MWDLSAIWRLCGAVKENNELEEISGVIINATGCFNNHRKSFVLVFISEVFHLIDFDMRFELNRHTSF